MEKSTTYEDFEEIESGLDEQEEQHDGAVGMFDIPGDGIEGVYSEAELRANPDVSEKKLKENIADIKKRDQRIGAFTVFGKKRLLEPDMQKIDLEEAA